MTPEDRSTVEALRHLAGNAAPAPGWEPDAVSVLRRARVLRVRRATGAVSLGAFVLALAVGIPALLVPDLRSPAPPAGPDAVTTVEPGIAAVRQPARGSRGALVAEVDGIGVTITQDGDDVQVVAESRPGTPSRGGSTWQLTTVLSTQDAGGPGTYSSSSPYPSVSENTSGDDQLTVLAGIVPSWQRDSRVFLFSAIGFPLDSEPVSHVAEVPTFPVPDGDGARMYVAVLTQPGSDLYTRTTHTVVFVGADGDSFWPECGRSTGTGTADEPGTCAADLYVSEDDLAVDPDAAYRGSDPRPSGGQEG